MEPYRPFVDKLVCQWIDENDIPEVLETKHKTHLLSIATTDVLIEGKSSPLMIAMSRTSNSLWECFEGSTRKILYPSYV
jgi:CRISPR-associated protein Cas1